MMYSLLTRVPGDEENNLRYRNRISHDWKRNSQPPSSKVFSLSGKVGVRAMLKLRFYNDQEPQIVSLEAVLKVGS